jgi:hypothetical protein
MMLLRDYMVVDLERGLEIMRGGLEVVPAWRILATPIHRDGARDKTTRFATPDRHAEASQRNLTRSQL